MHSRCPVSPLFFTNVWKWKWKWTTVNLYAPFEVRTQLRNSLHLFTHECERRGREEGDNVTLISFFSVALSVAKMFCAKLRVRKTFAQKRKQWMTNVRVCFFFPPVREPKPKQTKLGRFFFFFFVSSLGHVYSSFGSYSERFAEKFFFSVYSHDGVFYSEIGFRASTNRTISALFVAIRTRRTFFSDMYSNANRIRWSAKS